MSDLREGSSTKELLRQNNELRLPIVYPSYHWSRTMSAPSLDGLLEGIPREQLAARIASDLHLAEVAKKVTRLTDVVPYMEIGEVDEEDITDDHPKIEQQK